MGFLHYKHFLFHIFEIVECGCSKEGSFKDGCDDFDGKCQCKQGFKGDKCEICPNGKALELDEEGYSVENCFQGDSEGIKISLYQVTNLFSSNKLYAKKQ